MVTKYPSPAGSHFPSHPLDPLLPTEIRHAVKILRRDQFEVLEGGRHVINTLELLEPVKSDVLLLPALVSRQIRICVTLHDCSTWETIVDITSEKSISWKRILQGKPAFQVDEHEQIEKIVRNDDRFKCVKQQSWQCTRRLA